MKPDVYLSVIVRVPRAFIGGWGHPNTPEIFFSQQKHGNLS